MDITHKDTIISEIEKFKAKHGGEYSEYYIGITRDLKRRINEAWLHEHIRDGHYAPNTPRYEARAESRDIAFAIETEFQEKGMREYNPGGKGKEDSHFIYCFKLKVILINETYLPTASEMIRANIANGKEKIRMNWFKSFKSFFNIK